MAVVQLKLALVWAAAAAAAADAAATRPNILFVLTDDQDAMLDSLAPDGPCQTILREVAARGATFVNAFANTPICCPSRAEIATGRLMHNTGVLDNMMRGVH